MHQINLLDPKLKELSDLAGRVATVTERFRANPKDPAVGALDDLLGAIYALVSAVEEDFKGKTGYSEFEPILRRSQQLAQGQVRTDGNWMAGFHFNSAMFRIAAVRHRLPMAFGGHTKAKDAYLSKRGKAWDAGSAGDIALEVNSLKHDILGKFAGRKRVLQDATSAIEQLIDLAETLTSPGD